MIADTNPGTYSVWFRGQPYSVSANPLGAQDGGTIWHVRVGETWHPVRERRGNEPEHGSWDDVAGDVIAWLERNAART